MKNKKNFFMLLFIVVLAIGFSFIKFYNSNTFKKIVFQKEVKQYEEKYLSTKSNADLINLVYFLEKSEVLDERRLKYTPILIETISKDSIVESEMSDYYNQLVVDIPQTIPISFYMYDLLCFKQYDLFVDVFVKYYSSLSYNDQAFLSSVALEAYKNLRAIGILDALVDAYSNVAKHSEDEILINDCLSRIISVKDAVQYVDGETISIDNETLRSMTVDGEHIPITVKGKVVKYYSVTTGDYIDKTGDGSLSSGELS